MPLLVTGAAGFIGFHLCKHLLEQGHSVVGLDNLNTYYSVALKQARLHELEGLPRFRFVHADIADAEALFSLFAEEQFSTVLHMAAQAGVRYSLENPFAYVQSNMVGFLNILEACRRYSIRHLIFASSSSVYGMNAKIPFSASDPTDHPVSFYAATKKSNEVMAHSYSALYGLPVTGLRFFTVYGPWGRPDMAVYSFTNAVYERQPIPVFNHGRMQRDFTYIDDIVDGILPLLDIPATPAASWDPRRPRPDVGSAPYRIYNIGNNNPVALESMIDLLEKYTGCTAVRKYLPMQPGDVERTYADIDPLSALTGFVPRVSLEEGLKRFIAWYRDYHRR